MLSLRAGKRLLGATHYLRCSGRTISTAPKVGDTVVVAMSGGVDSSVTASLLAQNDYNLKAVFMRNWDTRDENASDIGCEWERDWEDVQRVCRFLDIPCSLVSQPLAKTCQVFDDSFLLRIYRLICLNCTGIMYLNLHSTNGRTATLQTPMYHAIGSHKCSKCASFDV